MPGNPTLPGGTHGTGPGGYSTPQDYANSLQSARAALAVELMEIKSNYDRQLAARQTVLSTALNEAQQRLNTWESQMQQSLAAEKQQIAALEKAYASPNTTGDTNIHMASPEYAQSPDIAALYTPGTYGERNTSLVPPGHLIDPPGVGGNLPPTTVVSHENPGIVNINAGVYARGGQIGGQTMAIPRYERGGDTTNPTIGAGRRAQPGYMEYSPRSGWMVWSGTEWHIFGNDNRLAQAYAVSLRTAGTPGQASSNTQSDAPPTPTGVPAPPTPPASAGATPPFQTVGQSGTQTPAPASPQFGPSTVDPQTGRAYPSGWPRSQSGAPLAPPKPGDPNAHTYTSGDYVAVQFGHNGTPMTAWWGPGGSLIGVTADDAGGAVLPPNMPSASPAASPPTGSAGQPPRSGIQQIQAGMRASSAANSATGQRTSPLGGFAAQLGNAPRPGDPSTHTYQDGDLTVVQFGANGAPARAWYDKDGNILGVTADNPDGSAQSLMNPDGTPRRPGESSDQPAADQGAGQPGAGQGTGASASSPTGQAAPSATVTSTFTPAHQYQAPYWQDYFKANPGEEAMMKGWPANGADTAPPPLPGAVTRPTTSAAVPTPNSDEEKRKKDEEAKRRLEQKPDRGSGYTPDPDALHGKDAGYYAKGGKVAGKGRRRMPPTPPPTPPGANAIVGEGMVRKGNPRQELLVAPEALQRGLVKLAEGGRYVQAQPGTLVEPIHENPKLEKLNRKMVPNQPGVPARKKGRGFVPVPPRR